MNPHELNTGETRIDDNLLQSLIQIDEAIRSGISEQKLDSLIRGSNSQELQVARVGLEALAMSRLKRATEASQPAGVPRHIGRFEIDVLVGTGGFAVVYRARDTYLNRTAAVKVPRLHTLASDDLRQRFLREAQAAAKLEHPHIVATYEAGSDAGIPYIAYAYCSGPTLAAWLQQRQSPLPIRLAAEIVRSLADAVQFSHSHGILHRDLKPSNVLLFPQPSVDDPSFPFVPKLADFGLAKQIDLVADETASGTMLGTPRYMAPEQISTRNTSIGPPVDVYGLGGILYELLTGRAAFTATSTWDVLTQVRDYAPAAPRLLRPQIPLDLETICLTCLAKDPAERYQSAADLSSDLERFLNGREILARPVWLPRQVWKWCTRHKLIASLGFTAIGACFLLVLALLVHSWQLDRLGLDLENKNARLLETVDKLDIALSAGIKAKQLAEDRSRELARTVYADEVRQAADAWKRGDVKTMAELLRPFSVVTSGEEDLRDFTWHFLWQQQVSRELFRTTLPAGQYVARFSTDGMSVAFAGADSVVRLFSARNFQLLKEIPTGQKEINGIIFSPTGDWLATAGEDGTVAKWDLNTGQRLAVWHFFEGSPAYQLAYSARLNLGIVCGGEPEVRLFEYTTGHDKGMLKGVHVGGVAAFALSPDGSRLLTCGADEIAAVWNLESRQSELVLRNLQNKVSAGAWSLDGQRIAVAPRDRHVYVGTPSSGEIINHGSLFDHVESMAVSREGLLLVANRGGSVSGYQPPWEKPELVPMIPSVQWSIHRDSIFGLDVSPDGTRFATASRDRDVVILKLVLNKPIVTRKHVDIRRANSNRSFVGPDRKGRTYWLSSDGVIMLPNGPESVPLKLRGSHHYTDLSLHGDFLLAGDMDGTLFRWNLNAPDSNPENFHVAPGLEILKIIPLDKDRVALRCGLQSVVLWNLATRSVVADAPRGENFDVSPNRRVIAVSSSHPNRLVLYDTVTLAELRSCDSQSESIQALTFSPTGRFLVTSGADRSIRTLDAETLSVEKTLSGNGAPIRIVAISPEERTLASSDDSGSIRLWDLRTGRELLVIYEHTGPLKMLEFTADGKELWGTDQTLTEFRWSIRESESPHGP